MVCVSDLHCVERSHAGHALSVWRREVFEGRLILFGCGDFLNDYEGIPGHEEFRGDLTLMHLPTLEAATGQLVEMALVPCRSGTFVCGVPHSGTPAGSARG